ncbi:MAG TPA: hypothetical protein VG474_02345 [Solirubrobacteraceae bacterium]|nr:hypothetical protein [Solirubrobacteraceae bacterium]
MADELRDVPVLRPAEPRAREAQTVLRWMYAWITIGVVVVLVVIGFLFAIANNVEAIDDNLEEAAEAVRGVESDVEPLPARIEEVNATLGRVEAELDPLPELANRVVVNLSSIDGSLRSVEATLNATESTLNRTVALLVDTEKSLVDVRTTLVDTDDALESTQPSLVDTRRALVDTESRLDGATSDLFDIRALTTRIAGELNEAQERESRGTNGIWRRVRFLNGGAFIRQENPRGLRSVERDTTRVVGGLSEVNKHLESACLVIPPLDNPLRLLLPPSEPSPPPPAPVPPADRPPC